MHLLTAFLCVNLLKTLQISIRPQLNSTKTYVQALKHMITKTLQLFLQWFKFHSPFTISNQTSVVAISTGLVSGSSVNCDQVYDIGNAAATAIGGSQVET